MRVVVDQEKLQSAVKSASRPVAKRATLPILSHLLVKVEDDVLSITGTNLEQTVTVLLDECEPSKAGEAALPAKQLGEILKANSGDVLLELKKKVVHITSNGAKYKLNALSADEVLEQLGGKIAAILDGGICPGGTPSTVVDCTGKGPLILRQGPISIDQIKSALG